MLTGNVFIIGSEKRCTLFGRFVFLRSSSRESSKRSKAEFGGSVFLVVIGIHAPRLSYRSFCKRFLR